MLKSKESPENVRKWCKLRQAVDISLKFCIRNKVRREAFNYRDGRLATAKATVYTAEQRCQVVLAERAVLVGLSKTGKVPNAKVAELMKGFKTAPGLDTFKPSFIDAAVTSDRLSKNKRAMKAFGDFKQQGFTSPMNSAYKTEQLVRKGGDDDGIAFCTELLVDQCKSKYVDTSGIPVEHLSGEMGNMLRFAYDFTLYLRGPWLSSFGLPKNIEGIIINKCSTPVLLREHVSPLPDSDAKPDRSWLGSHCAPYAKTAELIADVVANVVVDREFKGAMPSAVQSRKDPIDFLDYKVPAKAIEVIKKMCGD